MRKALLSLFSLGVIGSLLLSGCIIKETTSDSNDNETKGGSSSVGGTSAKKSSSKGSQAGNSSAQGGAGNEGGSSAATSSPAQCEGLEIKSDNGEACTTNSMAAVYRNIHLLIVLDKSKSMDSTPEGFEKTKWEATKEALDAAFKGSTPQVHYGLIMYPFSPDIADDKVVCEVPTAADAAVNIPIDVADKSVPAILSKLNETAPSGGTPTGAALSAALEYYTTGAGTKLPAGDKYVLLATDGAPNCNADASCDSATCTLDIDKYKGCGETIKNCCTTDWITGGGGPAACVDDQGVLDKIQALKDAGIKTFVVGIPGTENYKSFLTEFAEAGGVPDPKNSELKYYEVKAAAGVQGLTDTFKGITETLVRDCEVKLEKAPLNVLQLNVAVDCELLPQGDVANPNWVYNNDRSNPLITIKGSTCDTIEKKGVTRVDVIEGCTTVTIQ